jgi:hypothetical protein
MKTKNRLYLLAVTAAALSLSPATSIGQVFNSEDVVNNRAVAASPRAKEAFPWLTRSAPPRTEACCAVNELTAIKKNRALAASPRALEQFPELGRSAQSQTEFTIAPLVEKNAATQSSPRYREEHPALSRGTTIGTAKGGASKLMELGK